MARILVVDDSPMERAMVSAVIKKRLTGGAVQSASGGAEALEILRGGGIGLVVTDLMMPEINGLRLVEEIRRGSPRVPVILMTGYGNEDTAVQALRAGASSYVPKRECGTELVPTIEQILTIAAARRTESLLHSCIADITTTFVLCNDRGLIGPLVTHLESQIGGMRIFDEGDIIRIVIALQEAITNAMLHGNLELSSDLRQDNEAVFYNLALQRASQAPYRDRRVRITTQLSLEGLRFTIRDDGPGFDVQRVANRDSPVDLERIGGRGLLLIRSFMDVVYHNAAGNEISLIKYVRPETADASPTDALRQNHATSESAVHSGGSVAGHLCAAV